MLDFLIQLFGKIREKKTTEHLFIGLFKPFKSRGPYIACNALQIQSGTMYPFSLQNDFRHLDFGRFYGARYRAQRVLKCRWYIDT